MAAKDKKTKGDKGSDGLGEPVVKHVGGEDLSTGPSEADQHDIERGDDDADSGEQEKVSAKDESPEPKTAAKVEYEKVRPFGGGKIVGGLAVGWVGFIIALSLAGNAGHFYDMGPPLGALALGAVVGLWLVFKGIGEVTNKDRQKREPVAIPGPRVVHDVPPPPPFRGTIWNRATQRWIAVTAVLAFLLILYTQHPYYKHNGQFSPWRTIFPPFFFVWLAVGVLYMKVTLERWGAMRYLMRDAPLHLLILTKAFQEGKFWRRAKNRRIKTTLLTIIVKGFFTPLMIGFVTGHLNSISRAWLTHKHLPSMDYKTPAGASFFTILDLWWHNVAVRLGDMIPNLHDLAALVQPWTWSRADFSWGLGLFYDIIFAIDCGWALVGYGMESRWLGNKTRSVEPTAFGWFVCLACYPPYNNVLGTYLPLDNGPSVIVSDDWLLALRAITVVLFAIYAAATVAFGPRFSNLTNRGIVTRGPYAFVRHPAYLCKCSAWWMEHLPTMTITKAFFLSLLCGVYSLRAWTEERHLLADPDYVAYKKKVPWIIIPGIY